MIKPAATSASSSLALALGSQAASGEEAAVSADFAALLESSLTTAQDPASGEAAPLDLAALQQLRQDSGKTAGKKLPVDLPAAAAISETTLTVDRLADDVRPAEAAASVTTEILLPGLVVPIPSPLPQAALPAPAEQSTADSLGQGSAAQAFRPPLAASGETAPAAKLAASEAGICSDPVGLPASRQASEAVAAGSENPISRPAAMQPAEGLVAAPGSSAPAQPEPRTSPHAQADASAPSLPFTPALRTPPPQVTASPTADVNSAPNSIARAPEAAPIGASFAAPRTSTNDAATNRPAASPARGSLVHVTEGDPISARTSNPASQSAVQLRLAAQTATAKPVTTAAEKAATPMPSFVESAVAPAIQTSQPNASSQAVAPASQAAVNALRSEVTTPDAEAPARAQSTAAAPAAPAQPSASPMVQPMGSEGQSSIQAAAPIVTAPTAGSVAQTAHDFATLVDRLVEAREAAMPEAVQATIAHGEFGQVSLRFQQDAGGLSVAMSSADPEFGNAVQAAASSGQSQTASEHGSTAPRQDAPGQQQASGSSSGQSQASARNDKNGQTRAEPNSDRTAGEDGQDERRPDPRGGIYA